MVDRKVYALLASHNLGHIRDSISHTRPSGPKKRINGRKQIGQSGIRQRSRDEESFKLEKCYDCGEPGRRRGHDKCAFPSFFTSQLKKRRQESGNANRKDGVPGHESPGPFFNNAPGQAQASKLDFLLWSETGRYSRP